MTSKTDKAENHNTDRSLNDCPGDTVIENPRYDHSAEGDVDQFGFNSSGLENDSAYRELTDGIVEESLLPMYVRQGSRIVCTNQAMADMLGYESAQALRELPSVYSIVAQEDLTRASNLMALGADHKVNDIWHPITLLSAQGEPILAEAFRRNVNWRGKPASFLVYRDMRREAATVQALAASEARLCAILDACGQGIFAHDNGKILYANPAFKTLLGHLQDAPLDVLGNVFNQLNIIEQTQDLTQQQVCKSTDSSNCEALVRAIDGSEILVEMCDQVIDWDGQEASLVTVVDITDRKRVETELRLSEERFRDFARTAANWFWETDDQHLILSLSGEFEAINGRPISTRIGNKIMDDSLDYSAEGNKLIESIWATMEAHEPFRNVNFNRRSAAGERVTVQVSGVPVFDMDGRFTGYRGSSIDVTEERRLQDKIEYHATHDELTGLPNRRRFNALLEEAIKRVSQYGGCDLLVYVDLDGFKVVNDTAGHSVGDKLLQQCANVFTRLLSPADTVCRLGGDEFGFLIRNLSPTDASPLLDKIINAVSTNHFFHDGQSFTVGLSAGAVAVDGNNHTQEELLSQADLACYAAKELGRNRVYYFRESDKDAKRRQTEMRTAAHLREAIGQDRLTLYAQAIVMLQDRNYRVDHYEVLVRLHDQEGSIIAPDAFIPAAERYQLMDAVDRWVISESLRQIVDASLASSGDDVRLSINLSGSSLGDSAMSDFICDEINRWQVNPAHLCFEITETAAIQNMDTALRLIDQLKELGCRFALDDFGTGLSSFAYLQNLLVDELKIDGSFTQQLQNNPVNKAVVTAICDVGRSLGMSVVAERVEDKITADELQALGVTLGQGYYWSRPSPLGQVLSEFKIGHPVTPNEADAVDIGVNEFGSDEIDSVATDSALIIPFKI